MHDAKEMLHLSVFFSNTIVLFVKALNRFIVVFVSSSFFAISAFLYLMLQLNIKAQRIFNFSSVLRITETVYHVRCTTIGLYRDVRSSRP